MFRLPSARARNRFRACLPSLPSVLTFPSHHGRKGRGGRCLAGVGRKQSSRCRGLMGRNGEDRRRFAGNVWGGIGETDVASLRMFGEEWGRQMPLRCGRSGRNGGDRCRFAADGRGEGDGESTPVSPVPAASGDYPKAVDGALRQHSAPVGKRGGKRCRQKPKGGPERQGKRTEDRFGLKSICLCDCHFLAVINAS